jgi:hypothetical protein
MKFYILLKIVVVVVSASHSLSMTASARRGLYRISLPENELTIRNEKASSTLPFTHSQQSKTYSFLDDHQTMFEENNQA